MSRSGGLRPLARLRLLALATAVLASCVSSPGAMPRDPAGAAAWAEARLDDDPEELAALRTRGLAAWASGWLAEAHAHLARAAAAGDAASMWALGVVELERGDDAHARTRFRDALLGVAADARAHARGLDPAARRRDAEARAAIARAALVRLADDGGEPRREELERLAMLDVPAPVAAAHARTMLALAERAAPWQRSALARARGCAPAVLASGPSSPVPLAVLAAAPARTAPVPPSGGPSALVPAAGCRLDVTSPTGRPGLVLLEAWLASTAEQVLELEVRVDDDRAPARLWLDDVVVASRPGTGPLQPRVIRGRARPRPGAHRVLVELAIDDGVIPIELVVREAASGRAAKVSWLAPAGARLRPPTAVVVAGTLAEAVWPQDEARARPPGSAPLDGLLALAWDAEAALDRGDLTAAAWRIERIGSLAPAWPLHAELEARRALAQPGRPRAAARAQARAALAAALERDPGHASARLALVELALDGKDAASALELLGPASTWRAGREAALGARALASTTSTTDQGASGTSPGEASRASPRRATTGEGIAPAERSCAGARVAMERVGAGPLSLRRAAAQRVATCEPDATVLAELLRDAGDPALEIPERRRLAGLRPADPARWVALGRALVAAGRIPEAAGAFDAARRVAPADVDAALAAADLHAASGERAKAIALLEQAFRRTPARREPRDALKALGAPDPLAPLRVDGAAIFQAWRSERARHGDPGTPAVLVLDRQATLALDDGTRLVLTHLVAEVRSKEGLDRWGELRAPARAELLTARTLKQDGTTREPEVLDREGVTAPDLELGDAIELETLEVLPPAPWAAGFHADPFHFGVADAPTWRAELTVLAPRALGVRAFLAGGAPLPAVEIGLRSAAWAGEGERLTMTASHLGPVRPEPNGPPPAEVLPTVTLTAGTVGRDAPAWLVERSLLVRRTSPELVAEARARARGCVGARACARTLGEWIQRTIDDGAGPGEDPTLVLTRRRGSRIALLVAMLEALGIPAELALARPDAPLADRPRAPTPQPPMVGTPLVWIGRGRPDALILDLRDRGLVLGARLADLARGHAWVSRDPRGRALSWASRGPDVALPAATPGTRRVLVNVRLTATGGALARVEEVLTGEPAARWRASLTSASPREIALELEERVVGYHLPGATLGGLRVEGAHDPAVPLVVRYELEIPRYAAPDGSVRLHPFPLELGRRTVVLPARTTPLVLPDAWPARYVVRLEPPDGISLSIPPPARKLTAPGGVAELVYDVRTDGTAIVATFDESVASGARVAVAGYPAWKEFAAAVDEVESARVRIGAGPATVGRRGRP